MPPSSTPPPGYSYPPAEPPPYDPEVEVVLDTFRERFTCRSRFNITFSAVGVHDLLTFVRRNQLGNNAVDLVVNTMARAFYGVVALMEVEWRSLHCTPYTVNEITFQPNGTTTQPDLWVQHFDIVVDATSLKRVDQPSRGEALTFGGLTGLSNLGRRADLPSLPLSRSRRAAPLSDTQVNTGIDTNLSTWVLDETSHAPKRNIWIDRFTRAKNQTLPDSHRVLWQWCGASTALFTRRQDGCRAPRPELYANEFWKSHSPPTAEFPSFLWRTSPSLAIVFRGPRQLRALARSSTAGSSSASGSVNVFRR
ncbi:hypothetical protein JCM6882_009039 [Rhodosporidiobolus microsporus]